MKKIKFKQNTLWDSNGLIFGEKIVTFEAHQTQRIQLGNCTYSMFSHELVG